MVLTYFGLAFSKYPYKKARPSAVESQIILTYSQVQISWFKSRDQQALASIRIAFPPGHDAVLVMMKGNTSLCRERSLYVLKSKICLNTASSVYGGKK